jgi:hypothetical protein
MAKKRWGDEPEIDFRSLRGGARGDPRFYPKTNVFTSPDAPQTDSCDSGAIWWFGKRLWVGKNRDGEETFEKRLFWLLAKTPGRWHPIHESQHVVYGEQVDEHTVPDDAQVKKAMQRLRKLVNRLRDKFAEYKLDDHAIIVPYRYESKFGRAGKRSCPGYFLVLLSDQKYKAGEEPRAA